jgi:hypothetical protein
MQLQGGKPIGLWLSTQINVVLTITQKKTPFKHDYILHTHILEPVRVTSAKYLGVTLQSNLKSTPTSTISLQMEINLSQILKKKSTNIKP